jgi:hypothetical protein
LTHSEKIRASEAESMHTRPIVAEMCDKICGCAKKQKNQQKAQRYRNNSRIFKNILNPRIEREC